MTGFKTFTFFIIVGLLGLVTAFESIDVTSFLLPLVCQVEAGTDIVGNDCADNIIKLAGIWTTGLAAAGVFLRAITASPIFKALTGK